MPSLGAALHLGLPFLVVCPSFGVALPLGYAVLLDEDGVSTCAWADRSILRRRLAAYDSSNTSIRFTTTRERLQRTATERLRAFYGEPLSRLRHAADRTTRHLSTLQPRLATLTILTGSPLYLTRPYRYLTLIINPVPPKQ